MYHRSVWFCIDIWRVFSYFFWASGSSWLRTFPSDSNNSLQFWVLLVAHTWGPSRMDQRARVHMKRRPLLQVWIIWGKGIISFVTTTQKCTHQSGHKMLCDRRAMLIQHKSVSHNEILCSPLSWRQNKLFTSLTTINIIQFINIT